MNKQQFVKYSSPDFIAVVHSLKYKDIKPRGWFLLLQGGTVPNHIKAAQFVAFETRLQLIKIELSAVVSEYIGETEKNLNAVFEQTKSSRSVLLFDEADVLLNSRSDQGMLKQVFEIFREIADKTKQIIMLSNSGSTKIEKFLLEKIDIVIEFRSIK